MRRAGRTGEDGRVGNREEERMKRNASTDKRRRKGNVCVCVLVPDVSEPLIVHSV
jgi:hypothetical protein